MANDNPRQYVADAEEATLFHKIFEKRARESPQKRAILIDGRGATYGELDTMADRVAAWLTRHVLPGSHVAVYFPISVEAVASALGILKAGCVLVTNHPGFSEDKLVQQIESSESCILIAESRAAFKAAFARTSISHGLLIGHSDSVDDHRITRFEDLDSSYDGFVPEFTASRDLHAAIFHTTGSTFAPKGVVISHGNMIAAFQSITSYLNSSPQDVILHYASFSFDFGFYNTVMPLLFGGSSIAARAIPSEPNEIIATIQQEQVTALHFMPPVVFVLCQADVQGVHLSSVRYLSSTGQRLPTKYIRQLRRTFPAIDILSMYGMNEATRVLYLPPTEIDRRPDSVGKAIPGVRTYLINAEGQQITTPNVTGELAVAGDLVMQEYWKLPEHNARIFRYDVYGEHRVFLTGDMFRMDEDGYLYYVSRKDDVFTRGMFQVNPKEIENHLMSFDGVAEVVVAPIPAAGVGHVPKAYVVLEPGADWISEQILIDHCSAHLDWHMVPTEIEFRETLPRSLTGKTLIRGLDSKLDAEICRPAKVDAGYLKNTSMLRLARQFDELATGRRQVPRKPVRTEMGAQIDNPSVLEFHDIITSRPGPLFSHFLASIPYILEELCRVGVAFDLLARNRQKANDRKTTFYEADAFDGSNGRALHRYSKRRITTLTSSPNLANEAFFRSLSDSESSLFCAGTFLEVSRNSLAERDEFRDFKDGVDGIYEMAALQFYGKDRDFHIGHLASLLRPTGVAIFMHKLSHADLQEFEEREKLKDEKFKIKYFTEDEIVWKRQSMLDQMHTGLITLDETKAAVRRHFRYAGLIWNSGNFHEIIASNDKNNFDAYISLLGKPIIPDEFCTEKLGVW